MGEQSSDNIRAKGNLKGKRGVKWACEEKSKIKSSQEHSLTTAEMRLLKSEVGKMEYKEQSQCKAVSGFKYPQTRARWRTGS